MHTWLNTRAHTYAGWPNATRSPVAGSSPRLQSSALHCCTLVGPPTRTAPIAHDFPKPSFTAFRSSPSRTRMEKSLYS